MTREEHRRLDERLAELGAGRMVKPRDPNGPGLTRRRRLNERRRASAVRRAKLRAKQQGCSAREAARREVQVAASFFGRMQ